MMAFYQYQSHAFLQSIDSHFESRVTPPDLPPPATVPQSYMANPAVLDLPNHRGPLRRNSSMLVPSSNPYIYDCVLRHVHPLAHLSHRLSDFALQDSWQHVQLITDTTYQAIGLVSFSLSRINVVDTKVGYSGNSRSACHHSFFLFLVLAEVLTA